MKINFATDWHYQGIAQMLDAKTAATLARIPKVDLRFFLKPPPHHEAHLNEVLMSKTILDNANLTKKNFLGYHRRISQITRPTEHSQRKTSSMSVSIFE